MISLLEKLISTHNPVDIINSYSLPAYNTNIIIPSELLLKIKERYRNDIYESEVWEFVLTNVNEKQLPDDIIQYLIEKEICIVTLCHMHLKHKWLKKLIKYDNAPLITMASDYFLDKGVSRQDFAQFYIEYLNADLSCIYLMLELYEFSSKRGLFLFLLQNDNKYLNDPTISSYVIADQVSKITSSDELEYLFSRYSNNGIVLKSIANNCFTPQMVLEQLNKQKDCVNASHIRKDSNETKTIKKMIDR